MATVIGSRPIVRRYLLFIVLAGCGKSATVASTEPTAAPVVDQDPLDKAATLIVESLGKGDYDGLQAQTVQPLTHDLSRPEFDDLSAIVKWLGPLQQRTTKETDKSLGGGVRQYTMKFENAAELNLEVSLDAAGKVIGFRFSGDGYTEAERGVLSEPWREFKVYDFVYLDAEGNPLPKGAPLVGKRVDYEIVVGGIEAFVGEHHLTVEKIVVDADGKDVFREPIEFDVKFDEDAVGLPRGEIRGHLEVPGPGTWEMQLKIIDQNSHRDLEYKETFTTQ